MSAPTAAKLAVPIALLAAAVALVIFGRPVSGAARSVGAATAPAVLSLAPAQQRAGGWSRSTPVTITTGHDVHPGRVARAFIEGWLGCVYRQRSCAHIPGSLPAYAAALDRPPGESLGTPAELAARPRVVSLHVIRACRRSATAIVWYVDGEGGRFQLHVNLVAEPAGWHVFDIAEAPPHIPLPKPLTEGPRAC